MRWWLVVLLLAFSFEVQAADAGISREGSWDVRLDSFGESKIMTIKVVRDELGLGLKETKDLVESAPVIVKRGVSKEAAEAFIAKLKAAGAKCTPLLASN